jgi:hypothetical protein
MASKKLKYPKDSKKIDYIDVASFKAENNSFLGQYWVEFWLIKGNKDSGNFVQYADPNTGEIAYYIKLEDGCHPLAPVTALGKCDTCGVWWKKVSGPCETPSCEGEVEPYDGYSRFKEMTTANNKKIIEEFTEIVFEFLEEEEVPDPITWVNILLLELDEGK